MFFVYVLYTKKHAKHYTGFTSDLEKRLISHNELGNGWTSRYRPWILIYSKSFDTKKEALNHEKWLKTGIGRSFINSLSIEIVR
jgi:putative endonuclease